MSEEPKVGDLVDVPLEARHIMAGKRGCLRGEITQYGAPWFKVEFDEGVVVDMSAKQMKPFIVR